MALDAEQDWQRLADRAEEYAHRLVVEEEKNEGWLWLSYVN